VTAPIPPDALPPDAPATVEDVRASRRWTWVALAWAVAASAIAVIALISASDNKTGDQPTTTAPDTSAELQKFEKQTNDRLDAFSRRLNGTAKTSDVQKLEKRVTTAEDDSTEAKDAAGKASQEITKLQTQVDDLKQRVDELEKNQQNQPTTP
jgi:peptidoglycan hydrolase CwlO-like protein